MSSLACLCNLVEKDVVPSVHVHAMVNSKQIPNKYEPNTKLRSVPDFVGKRKRGRPEEAH